NQHRHEPDVVVAYVRHLVRDNALQLLPVEELYKALGDGDGAVLRVAARGEGVGSRRVYDVHVGPRYSRADGNGLGDVDEIPVLGRRRLVGARSRERDLVGEVEADEALRPTYSSGRSHEEAGGGDIGDLRQQVRQQD